LGFVIKKVSDYGSSNPIVARTSLQVINLLQAFSISQPNKERIFKIYFTMVQPKLIRCMEITNRIYAEINEIDAKLREHGLITQSGGRVLELPHVAQLQEDVETYLYNAKSALRDIALVLEPFFGKSFDHSRYQEISKWALDNFGEGEPLPALLATDQEWIKDVVKRRNAVEHPGGYSGYLHVENYQVASIEGIEEHHIIQPTWRLNDDKPTLLLPDLSVTLSNILEFAEDLLVACLKNYGSRFPIVFYEIPEEERN
jgi:hypothetical protein